MKTTLALSDACAHLAFEGRLDSSWADTASAALDEAIRSARARIELDLSRVDFISSVGIGVIVRAHGRFRTAKGTLAIVAATDSVRDMLRISRLDFLLQAPAEPKPHAPEHTTAFGKGWHGAFVETAPASAMARVELLRDGIVTLDAETIALGHFALARDLPSARGNFGEGLAAGGTVAVAPASSPRPDCLASSADGRKPEHFVSFVARNALVVRGPVALQGHFERSTLDPLTLRSLATELAGAARGPIAFVAIGESGGAFGAWARVSPDHWPRPVREMSTAEMRANLRFAGEPMHAGESLGVVAIACPSEARGALPAEVADQLAACGAVLMHAHAATVSYRPVPRTTRDILAAGALLAEQPLRAVMHAVHLEGPAAHTAETTFVRGSFWAFRLGGTR